jgi:hypothetical protein
VVITEIQDFFHGELSAVVGDDRVRDPKVENDALDEVHCLHGANLFLGTRLDPLGKFVDCDKKVGQVPRAPS